MHALIFPMGHTHTHTHTLSLSHTHTLQSKDKRLAITETWNQTPPINITILCVYANQWNQKRNSYNEGTKGDRSPLPMTAALWNISVAQACHKTWGDHNLEEKRGYTQLLKKSTWLNLPRESHTHTHTCNQNRLDTHTHIYEYNYTFLLIHSSPTQSTLSYSHHLSSVLLS